ncbi:MAG: CoA-binding protein [Alphaproteobacteria bacterium]|nr:CoA-binding protein [Alphaproteobacteria bacterium]
MTPAPDIVGRIVDPRSVAVIGASEDPRKFGGRVLRNILHHRFAGALYPINPNRPTLLGLPAYASPKACPGPIDVAILAVPKELLLASVTECAEAGVGCTVVITSQLAETGPEGAGLQARVVDAAHAHGMRLIGPNCLGYISPYARLAINSSPAMEATAMAEGAIGLVSQSGALMATLFNRAGSDGIGFSFCISVGNQADLEATDFVAWLADDPRTRAICVYLEGLLSPARFLTAAARALQAGKRVFLLKAGRSEAGAKAALSHTGSLAGSHQALKAAARDHGIVLADDLDAMVRAADLWVRHGSTSGGIGVVSPSGGGGAITVDRMADFGLPLAAIAAATTAALGDHITPAQVGNPLDLGAGSHGVGPEYARAPIAILGSDGNVGALLVVVTTAPMLDEFAATFGQAARDAAKPLAVVMLPGSAGDAARAVLRVEGVPTFDSLDAALRSLGLWLAAGRASLRIPPPRPHGIPVAPPSLPAHAVLTEPEVKALLTAYGVPVTRERVVASAEEALAAAQAIGYPVALKLLNRALSHKSDVGGVVLDLGDDPALRGAFATMVDNRHFAGHALVQEMAAGGTELIVGARFDPDFGALILIGFGGTLVELVGDVRVALAPLAPAEAEGQLRALKLWPILAGARGRPPADLAALAGAISRVSWLVADLGPRLSELDVNPLLAREDGVLALDGRARLEPA